MGYVGCIGCLLVAGALAGLVLLGAAVFVVKYVWTHT